MEGVTIRAKHLIALAADCCTSGDAEDKRCTKVETPPVFNTVSLCLG